MSMHTIDFKYAYAKNILCFGPEGIEIDLTALAPITQVDGVDKSRMKDQGDPGAVSNGVGKSSLPEILGYGIYGKTIKGAKGSGRAPTHEDVIHDGTGKDLKVEVHLNDLRIIRTRKPNSLRLWQSEAGTWDDSTELTLGGIPATQELIEKLVGLSFEAFCGQFVFDDDNRNTFLELDAAGKRGVVENLLGLEQYRRYAETAKEMRSKAKKVLATLQGQHEAIVAETNRALARRDDLASKNQVWKKQKEEEIRTAARGLDRAIEALDAATNSGKAAEILAAREQMEAADQRAVAILDKLTAATTMHEKVLAARDKADQDFEAIDQVARAAEQAASVKQQMVQTAQRDVQTAERAVEAAERDVQAAARVVEQHERDRKTIEREIDKVRTMEGTCPTCRGEINPENAATWIVEKEVEVQAIQAKVVEAQAKVDLAREGVERVKEGVTAAQAKVAEARQDAQETQDLFEARDAELAAAKAERVTRAGHVKKVDEAIASLRQTQAQLQAEHARLARIAAQDAGDDVRVAEAGVNAAEERLNRLQAEVKSPSPFQKLYDTAETDLADRYIERDAVATKVASTEAQLPYLEYWVKGFGDGGIRKHIVAGVIESVNERLDYWMDLLIGNGLSIRFDEDLSEHISSPPDDSGVSSPRPYQLTSGGEKQRINLAVAQAFAHVLMADTGRSLNVVYLDEVTRNIDPEGVECVYRLIQELSQDRKVLVTTHDPILREMLSPHGKITLVKEFGATRLLPSS